MHVLASPLPLWALELSAWLWQAPPQTFVELSPSLSDPKELVRFGAVRSVGLPQGQAEDFRFPPDPWGGGLHLWKMPDGRVLAHLDRYHPSLSPIAHLRNEAPIVWIGAATALGASIAGALGGASLGVLGGAIGLLAGRLTSR